MGGQIQLLFEDDLIRKNQISLARQLEHPTAKSVIQQCTYRCILKG
jgi:hypothetical protein